MHSHLLFFLFNGQQTPFSQVHPGSFTIHPPTFLVYYSDLRTLLFSVRAPPAYSIVPPFIVDLMRACSVIFHPSVFFSSPSGIQAQLSHNHQLMGDRHSSSTFYSISTFHSFV